MTDLDEAIDRVMMGPAKKSKNIQKKIKFLWPTMKRDMPLLV